MKNTTRILLALAALVVLGGVAFYNLAGKQSSELERLTLALDWTPNTNHTGIYVALQNGWYKEEGIDLEILPYGSVLPDTLVYSGAADIGISSTEAVVADAAVGAPVVSIAAIIAHNTSSLAVRKDSGITRPAELEGKLYGGYGASYEEPVISTIIKTDGGTGAFKNVVLDVDALEALRAGRIDFTWIFDAWQGVQAKREGFELMTFPITAYGIPDYSTPNIIASPATLAAKKKTLRKFMRATARGYEYAREHPREAADILIKAVPEGTFPDKELVIESQAYLSPRYADAGKAWGLQSSQSWSDYPTFMLQKNAVLDSAGKAVKRLELNSLYTNDLLP